MVTSRIVKSFTYLSLKKAGTSRLLDYTPYWLWSVSPSGFLNFGIRYAPSAVMQIATIIRTNPTAVLKQYTTIDENTNTVRVTSKNVFITPSLGNE
jgi:hypothetical protein